MNNMDQRLSKRIEVIEEAVGKKDENNTNVQQKDVEKMIEKDQENLNKEIKEQNLEQQSTCG